MFLYLINLSYNFLVEKKISKSTPNDPKREKRSPVLPIGRPAGPSGGPNLTGDRFFSVFITPNDPKREKTVAGFADRSVRSVRRTEFDRRPFFSPFGSFGVDLEIFFSTKKFWPKKTFQLNIWHHAVNSEIFLSFFWSKILVENFFSKSTPNDPKREKTWKKNRRTNFRFCRPDRPADRIWPFFRVEHVK